MNDEVNQTIAELLSKSATLAKRRAALKRLSEVLEEDYILNLPPQRPILKGLEKLSEQTGVEPALKSKAKKLIKTYGI
ncbi:MAG: hypothetical protein ACSHX4_00285 [Opitutaceae bacterium]